MKCHGSNDQRLRRNLFPYQVALVYLLQQRTSKDLDFRNISSRAHWSWRRFFWILLRSLRCCIKANCRTEMANIKTSTTNDSTQHAWNFLWLRCLRVGFLWNGKGRRRCPHPRLPRSGASFPWSSCWAPADARRWWKKGKKKTEGRLENREWNWSSQRDNAHMDDMRMRCGQGSNLSQCESGWSVRGNSDTMCIQWNSLWRCTMWSATQSLMYCVVQFSTSSLVFISSCFPSCSLLSTLSSQFSFCSSSSNSFP